MQLASGDAGPRPRPRRIRASPTGKPARRVYSAAFKLEVVAFALAQPPSQRIRPACREFPGLEPVQLRKWIRNAEQLRKAPPHSRLVRTREPKPATAVEGRQARGATALRDMAEGHPGYATPTEGAPARAPLGAWPSPATATAPSVPPPKLPSFTSALPAFGGLAAPVLCPPLGGPPPAAADGLLCGGPKANWRDEMRAAQALIGLAQ